jgi:hypothetical protein
VSEPTVAELRQVIEDALDLLGGMWSWSEDNGYFLSQTGWVGMTAHLLRDAAGRPANPDNADAMARCQAARDRLAHPR